MAFLRKSRRDTAGDVERDPPRAPQLATPQPLLKPQAGQAQALPAPLPQRAAGKHTSSDVTPTREWRERPNHNGPTRADDPFHPRDGRTSAPPAWRRRREGGERGAGGGVRGTRSVSTRRRVRPPAPRRSLSACRRPRRRPRRPTQRGPPLRPARLCRTRRRSPSGRRRAPGGEGHGAVSGAGPRSQRWGRGGAPRSRARLSRRRAEARGREARWHSAPAVRRECEDASVKRRV